MGRSADQQRIGATDQSGRNDTGCTFLHVDMDAFFASVEIRRDPSLQGKPVIVGGYRNRGVVAAASYEARKYGVKSAMAMGKALRLCPHAVVLPGRHSEYQEVSSQVMAILRDITPQVQPLSLDEAFLDIRGSIRLLGAPVTIATQIRERVERELSLTCSVGIASVLFVAKIASTRCKPDGMLVVPADRVLDFLHPLPVSALWGVGPTTERKLISLGMQSVGDIALARPQTLRTNLGAAAAAQISALANGQDVRAVSPTRVEKSIGAEETFLFDLVQTDEAITEIHKLCQLVGARLRRAGRQSRSVALKLRTADFTTLSRSRVLPEATDTARDLYEAAAALWTHFERTELQGRGMRLIGVRAEKLEPADSGERQLSFDDLQPAPDWAATERAVDSVIERFGSGAVGPAALLRNKPGSGR